VRCSLFSLTLQYPLQTLRCMLSHGTLPDTSASSSISRVRLHGSQDAALCNCNGKWCQLARHVLCADHLITGQNHASARLVTDMIIEDTSFGVRLTP